MKIHEVIHDCKALAFMLEGIETHAYWTDNLAFVNESEYLASIQNGVRQLEREVMHWLNLLDYADRYKRYKEIEADKLQRSG